MASVRTRSFSHPLPGDWIMSNLQRIGRDAAAPIQICLASTTLTAMLARRGQLEVVVMPPAAWSAREIEQAQATLAALAQISTPSAAHFLKSHQLLVQKFAADRDRQKKRRLPCPLLFSVRSLSAVLAECPSPTVQPAPRHPASRCKPTIRHHPPANSDSCSTG